MQLSMFSSAELPANRSASPDSEKVWMTSVVTWRSNFVSLLAALAPNGSYGRTSPVCSAWTAGELSPPSSEGWQNAGMVSPTECWTLSLSESTGLDGLSLNDDGVCSLSDVLETGDVPPQYYLSARACRGILRRAVNRGKDLPMMLHRALSAVAEGLNEAEVRVDNVVGTLNTNSNASGRNTAMIAFSAKDYGGDAMDNLSPTLRAGGFTTSHANAGVMPAIAFNARQDPDSGPVTHPLDTDGSSIGVLARWRVRRLTPVECERLQGFPDGYTDVPYRGKRAADGPRYKALGNSMAVNCMRWIGRRIERVDAILQAEGVKP